MNHPKVPSVKMLVTENRVARFVSAHSRELWYEIVYFDEDGKRGVFTFPIPFDDTDGATFLVEDKALYFMRWIRKRVLYWNKVNEENP